MGRQLLAQGVRRLAVLGRPGLVPANGLGEDSTLLQGLAHGVAVPEEVGRPHLLPKIAGLAVVVLHQPVQVLLHQGPDTAAHAGLQSSIGHGSDGAETWAIVLRPAPAASVGGAFRDEVLRLHEDVDVVWVRLVLGSLQPRDPSIHLRLHLLQGALRLQVGVHAQRAVTSPRKIIITPGTSSMVGGSHDLASSLRVQVRLEVLHDLLQLSIREGSLWVCSDLAALHFSVAEEAPGQILWIRIHGRPAAASRRAGALVHLLAVYPLCRRDLLASIRRGPDGGQDAGSAQGPQHGNRTNALGATAWMLSHLRGGVRRSVPSECISAGACCWMGWVLLGLAGRRPAARLLKLSCKTCLSAESSSASTAACEASGKFGEVSRAPGLDRACRYLHTRRGRSDKTRGNSAQTHQEILATA